MIIGKMILKDKSGFDTTEVTSSFIAKLCDDIENFAISLKANNSNKGNSNKGNDTLKDLAKRVVLAEVKMSEIKANAEDLRTPLVDFPETIENALLTETRTVLKFVESMGMDLFDYERLATETKEFSIVNYDTLKTVFKTKDFDKLKKEFVEKYQGKRFVVSVDYYRNGEWFDADALDWNGCFGKGRK